MNHFKKCVEMWLKKNFVFNMLIINTEVAKWSGIWPRNMEKQNETGWPARHTVNLPWKNLKLMLD